MAAGGKRDGPSGRGKPLNLMVHCSREIIAQDGSYLEDKNALYGNQLRAYNFLVGHRIADEIPAARTIIKEKLLEGKREAIQANE